MFQKKIIDLFEQEFAAYIGTEYAIGTSMGRTALFAVLKAIGVKEKDEIIMPAYICEVVPNSVLRLKAVPIFVDINLMDYHISLPNLRTLINSRTKAIIIDHIFGYPEDVDAIKEIINRSGYKIFLIEDAAHALGASYKGKKTGSMGDAAIFSLTKNLVNIGGGVVTTNDSCIARSVKFIVNRSDEISLSYKIFFGMLSFFDKNRVTSKFSDRCMHLLETLPLKIQFFTKGYQQSQKIPTSMKMSKLQAYFSLHQIKKIDLTNEQRYKNKTALDYYFNQCNEIKVIKEDLCLVKPICTWYVMRIPSSVSINKILITCKKRGIYLSKFWIPPIIQNNKNFIQKSEDIPNTVASAKSTLVFKLNPLSIKEREKIVKCILCSLKKGCE